MPSQRTVTVAEGAIGRAFAFKRVSGQIDLRFCGACAALPPAV